MTDQSSSFVARELSGNPRDLRKIVDDRDDRGSLPITSQVPASKWQEVIADPTLGDAIH